MDPEGGALGAVQGQLPQFRRIHPADVEEPGAEVLHIRPPEGAVSVQLDMVLDDHHIPGAVIPVDGPGGVGKDDGFYPQQLQNPDGDHQFFKAVALVRVEAAGHAHNLPACHRAENQLPGVGCNGGEKEVGDAGVVHHDGILNGLGKGPQAGAQNNANLRDEVHLGPQVIGAGLEIFAVVGHGWNTS